MPRKTVVTLNRGIHILESLQTFMELHKHDWDDFNDIPFSEVTNLLSVELQAKRVKRDGFCATSGIPAYDRENPSPSGIYASEK